MKRGPVSYLRIGVGRLLFDLPVRDFTFGSMISRSVCTEPGAPTHAVTAQRSVAEAPEVVLVSTSYSSPRAFGNGYRHPICRAPGTLDRASQLQPRLAGGPALPP